MLQDRTVIQPGEPVKSKKSLAEKISRTLDKIASVTTSPSHREGERRGRNVHPQQSLLYPLYQGYSPGYRTVRGPHGVSYQYVYGGWDPSVYGIPPGHDFGDTRLDYQPSPTPMGGPFMPPNYCRCPDNGKESVRTKSGQSKCKKCSKPKTPYVQRGTNGSHQPKSRAKLQLSDTHHSPSPASVARSAGKAWDPPRQTRQSFGPKDPYDYIRRTRLKADDWDTYWESSGDPEMTPPSRHSPQRSTYGNNNGNKYIKHSKTSPEARKGQGSDARNMSTPKISDSKIETDGHIKEVSRQNDKRQPLDMRMTVCDLMEDEDSSQPESKPISNLEPSAKSPKLGGQSIQGNAKTSSPTPNPSSSNKDSKNENSSSDGLESENDLSANLLADLVLMKSKISVAEMRYRKFQRRNPLRKLSLQIDEVIMEEDEEALENEDRDYKIYKQSLLTTVLEDELDEEKESSGSDDELGIGKFNHVIGNSNFADEILSEIYGVTGGSQCSDTGKPSEHDSESRQEGGAVEDYTPSRSLADEILDELYGKTIQNNSLYNQPDNEYCNMEDLRIGDGSHNNDNEFCEETTAEGQQDRLKSELLEADGEILSTSENYSIIGYGGRTRLYRSASLQEKGGGLGLSLLLNDTTRFKLSHRPSLLHLLPEDQAILLPNLPGTPTLHRPSRPPPPPPNNTHPLLQPFNSLELSRINNVIRNADTTSNGDDSSGSEFSDDEFDPIDMDYENIPMERPPPEGAEADAEYDVPELNESFEQEPCGSGDLDISCDRIVDLDTSFNSSCIGDISSDSLMLPRVMDTSFDRDSINSVDSHHYQESHISSHNSGSGSVIQNHGEKTIILSPALAQSRALPKGVDQNQSENKLFISSASWINIDGLSENVHSVGVIKSPEIHIVSEENGNCADLSNINLTEQSLEPVKPPRLKKLARQQSKQEMLRAKGFGLSTSIKSNISSQVLNENINSESHKSIKGLNYNPSQLKARPEIGLPILINSTLNSEDLENHKCITLHSSDEPFLLHGGPSSDEAEICSVYRAPSSDTDSSFYMGDSVIEEAYNNTGAAATDIYNEHIYEEIPENRHKVRPLPPIPEGALGSALAKSIFTGATKYEILHYLNDAKQRMEGNVVEFDGVNEDNDGSDVNNFLGNRNHKHRVSAISNISDSSNSSNDSSGDGSVLWRGPLDKIVGRVEIERNDSGVGSDSGISSCKIPTGEVSSGCEDCEITLPEDELVCLKCLKRRGERKEIITEIVETEVKYGRDLRIIVEEFYRPMLVAGLLSSDHLASIFLNVEQLIQVNTSFTVKLKEALDQASAAEDEDLCTVKIGSLFIHAMPMLQAFEAYCTKQAASSMLLANMEREKELLRVFLKVSQMENKILRRMNLSSFLMVPVQRVTKYPLLLARLLKVTPAHHGDRDNIREAQARIESALEQINKDAKEIIAMKGSWRRGGQSNKKMGIQREMNNMRVRKLSLEMLGWTREETRFALEGRLTFAHVTDSNWRMKWKGTVNTGMKLVTANALLVVTSKPGNAGFPINNNVNSSTPSPADLHTSTNIIFPKPESIGDAVLLLVREKTSRFSTVRDPFFLEKSIVCCEQDWEYEYFEIHEFGSKDSYVFKADDPNMTGTWFQALQFYSQCLGGWRKRRKGLGNIMVDPGLS